MHVPDNHFRPTSANPLFISTSPSLSILVNQKIKSTVVVPRLCICVAVRLVFVRLCPLIVRRKNSLKTGFVRFSILGHFIVNFYQFPVPPLPHSAQKQFFPLPGKKGHNANNEPSAVGGGPWQTNEANVGVQEKSSDTIRNKINCCFCCSFWFRFSAVSVIIDRNIGVGVGGDTKDATKAKFRKKWVHVPEEVEEGQGSSVRQLMEKLCHVKGSTSVCV